MKPATPSTQLRKGAFGGSPASHLPSSQDRRSFLGSALAMVSGMAVARMASGAAEAREAGAEMFALDDQQPFNAQTRRLKITRSGLPVAALIFPTDYPTHFRLKPELFQVCTPSGVPVTGSHEYCFIHHQSIMCGHGKVQMDGDPRVVDFYRQLPFPDPARSDKWHATSVNHNLFHLGPSGLQRVTKARWRVADQVVIQLNLAWQTREIGRELGGDTLLVEERFYRIARAGAATVVDVFSKLTPASRPVTLVPENDHGFIGVRMHDLIDVEDGGVMRDSEGRNPNGYFRAGAASWNISQTPKPAGESKGAEGEGRVPRWVDCTGKIGNATVGMTLMSHPANVRNAWGVREFGLMIISGAQQEPVRITAEKPFEFAARFAAHDGQLPPEVADRLHAQFAAVKADELRAFLEG